MSLVWCQRVCVNVFLYDKRENDAGSGSLPNHLAVSSVFVLMGTLKTGAQRPFNKQFMSLSPKFREKNCSPYVLQNKPIRRQFFTWHGSWTDNFNHEFINHLRYGFQGNECKYSISHKIYTCRTWFRSKLVSVAKLVQFYTTFYGMPNTIPCW